MAKPHGERIAVLETEMATVKDHFRHSTESLIRFADKIEKLERQIGRVSEYIPAAMWLFNSLVVYALSGPVVHLFQKVFEHLPSPL